jgi:hypothetical protein
MLNYYNPNPASPSPPALLLASDKAAATGAGGNAICRLILYAPVGATWTSAALRRAIADDAVTLHDRLLTGRLAHQVEDGEAVLAFLIIVDFIEEGDHVAVIRGGLALPCAPPTGMSVQRRERGEKNFTAECAEK